MTFFHVLWAVQCKFPCHFKPTFIPDKGNKFRPYKKRLPYNHHYKGYYKQQLKQ